MTSLVVEAVKKMMTAKAPTITAAIVSVIMGIAVPVGYLVLNHLTITAQDVVYIVAMCVLTWLCSTLGYDKVVQAVMQLRKDCHEDK